MIRLALALALLAPAMAQAHQFRTAYLEVLDQPGGHYDLSWRVPAATLSEPAVELVAGPGCALRSIDSATSDTIQVIHDHLDCTPGAEGWVALTGLDRVSYDAVAKVVDPEDNAHFQHLHGDQQRVQLTPLPGPGGHNTMLVAGLEHVFTGYDHLAYMLLLFLFLRGRCKDVLVGVTTFTVAHSLTLALSVTGAVHVRPRPVEAVIALTIFYFASSLLRNQTSALVPAWKWRAVVGACGLVHGLGFANSLSETGFDHTDLLWGLATFNAGIECAQLLFIAGIATLLGLVRMAMPAPSGAASQRAATTAIGAVAVFWYLQRVLM